MKCVIGACVYNAEKYLKNSFKNLETIITSNLFEEYLLIFSYDNSDDDTLEMLTDYKQEMKGKYENVKIKIIVNTNGMFNIITVNIATARNKILDIIFNTDYKYEYKYDYFIMIDMNYIHEKKLNIEVLTKHLNTDLVSEWDALMFNMNPYYDIWALSLSPYYISVWHWINPDLVKTKMINNLNEKLSKLNDGELLECVSAFGGFGIYKTEKFVNCKYTGLFELDKIYKFGINVLNNIKALRGYTRPLPQYHPPDCEHKYFHMDAIKNNEARIRVSPECLFN